jgi:putative sterol carrier protein
MTDADLSAEAIGKLSPAELITLLTQLDPHDEASAAAIAQLDVDAIGRAIDPKRLGKGDVTRLLTEIERLSSAGTNLDLDGMSPKTFARLISRASEAQLRDVLGRPSLRRRILTEIFGRMQQHLRRERAVDAEIQWRFTDGAGDDGYDRFTSVIADGACTTTPKKADRPKVTITLGPYEFLRLITNNASAPVLFMTGKLRVRGDLAFAAGMMGMFDLPRA